MKDKNKGKNFIKKTQGLRPNWNNLKSEATSLFDVRRSMFDVGRSFFNIYKTT